MGLMQCCRPSSSSWALDPRWSSPSTSRYPHAADVQTETGRGSGFPEVCRDKWREREGRDCKKSTRQEKNQDSKEERGDGTGTEKVVE